MILHYQEVRNSKAKIAHLRSKEPSRVSLAAYNKLKKSIPPSLCFYLILAAKQKGVSSKDKLGEKIQESLFEDDW